MLDTMSGIGTITSPDGAYVYFLQTSQPPSLCKKNKPLSFFNIHVQRYHFYILYILCVCFLYFKKKYIYKITLILLLIIFLFKFLLIYFCSGFKVEIHLISTIGVQIQEYNIHSMSLMVN